MSRAAPLTVATWNVAGGHDPSGRPFDVVARCAELDVDVLALQETVSPERDDLAAMVAERLGYVHTVTATEPGRRAQVALLSRIPLTPRAAVSLSPAPGWCGARRVARALLDPGGWEVSVSVLHLCHRPDTAARQLWRLARALGADRDPALFLGDCNLWGALVRRMLPGWTAATPGPTWPADRPRHSIDQVLTRGLRVADSAVVDLGGSDHRAVRATLMHLESSESSRPVRRPRAEGM